MAAGTAGKACPPPLCHAAHATAAPRDPLPPKPCPLLLPRATGSRSSAPRCSGISPVSAHCSLCHQHPALLHPGAGCSPPRTPTAWRSQVSASRGHGCSHPGNVPISDPHPAPQHLCLPAPPLQFSPEPPLPSSPLSSPHTPTLQASLPFPAHVSTHTCSLSLSTLSPLLVTRRFHFPCWPHPAHPTSCSFSCSSAPCPTAPGCSHTHRLCHRIAQHLRSPRPRDSVPLA